MVSLKDLADLKISDSEKFKQIGSTDLSPFPEVEIRKQNICCLIFNCKGLKRYHNVVRLSLGTTLSGKLTQLSSSKRVSSWLGALTMVWSIRYLGYTNGTILLEFTPTTIYVLFILFITVTYVLLYKGKLCVARCRCHLRLANRGHLINPMSTYLAWKIPQACALLMVDV